MLADLDVKQATSAEWAKRRKAAGHQPAIEARLTSQRQVWELRRSCSLLVIDAPGYADNSTLELAAAFRSAGADDGHEPDRA